MESASASTCLTYATTLSTFTATACARPGQDAAGACSEAYCATPTGVQYPYLDCTVSASDITDGPNTNPTVHPSTGICTTHTVADGQRLALATFTQRWRNCGLAQDGLSCSSFTATPPAGTPPTPVALCVDLSTFAANNLLKPPAATGVRDGSENISSLVLNSSACPLVGDTSTATRSLTAGNIGTAVGGGTSTPVSLTSGFATIGTFCDPFENCSPSIDRLQANLGNVTVAGATVTNVIATSLGPIVLGGIPDPDSGAQTVATRGVTLALRGRVNGVDSFFLATNSSPWTANLSGGTFNLRGPLNLLVNDASGKPLSVTMNVNVNGTPANSQQQACAALSPIGRLFGFEDPVSWSATNASLSLVTSPITQGCGALGINGQGFMPINGASFATSAIVTNQALSVDLFIPSNQPNPSWLGALQMYLTCPSGNVFNQFIGQVELTGKPQNQYSTLRFPLPSATMATLTQPLSDCSFGFGLNVNQTNGTWILDNLRFTN
jgi:hypothetical protein